MRNFLSILALLMLFVSLAGAENRPSSNPPRRSKSLDFSGELVEGVNRQSMDSLVSFSQRTDAKKNTFLYNKRDNFEDENQTAWRDLALGF